MDIGNNNANSMETKIEQMKEMIEKLNQASYAYYQEDREILSNNEYDLIYSQLQELEKETGITLAGSSTEKVGYEVLSNLEKVNHATRMLSLDKTKSKEDLVNFLGDEEGILSWKLDGLTIVLTYKDGRLEKAVTRGNGEIGEDVTHNARFFQNTPLKINYKSTLIVRGEAVISYSEFDRINSGLSTEEQYKNPRNLASGTVRQLKSENVARRNVDCLIFSLVDVEYKNMGEVESMFRTKHEELAWLRELGFQTVDSVKVTKDNVVEAVENFKNTIIDSEYASDGLVLSYNDVVYGKSLGETAKFPKDSVAFKWEDKNEETTLKNIVWNTSRTGLINPIAVFEPVELEGTTVERASLHNVSIVENLKLGVGDTITVYKANMIIPQIHENLTKSNTCEIPTHCFVCGSEAHRITIKDGTVLKCENVLCPAKMIQSLVHFASRNAMNIEGLSEATIEKFVAEGFIKEYHDIYNLEKYADKIKGMDGFGEKSCEKLLNSINNSRTTRLHRIIYGLGIDQVGLSNAKLLSKECGYDFDRIRNAGFEELSQIDGFGIVIALSVNNYFTHPDNTKNLDKLMEYLTIEKPNILDADEEDLPLSELTFVITGDLNDYANREELKEVIEKNGGQVTGSVTKKTNFLINNDSDSVSAKNKKAKELDVAIITEEEFKDKFPELL